MERATTRKDMIKGDIEIINSGDDSFQSGVEVAAYYRELEYVGQVVSDFELVGFIKGNELGHALF